MCCVIDLIVAHKEADLKTVLGCQGGIKRKFVGL